MKKLLIGTLVALSLVSCQKKDLSLKEQLQLSQELQNSTIQFAESLTGTETYNEIMAKALNYANDVFESLEKRNLQDDLTNEDVENYVINYVENNFKYLKEQEEKQRKLDEAQQELEDIKNSLNN